MAKEASVQALQGRRASRRAVVAGLGRLAGVGALGMLAACGRSAPPPPAPGAASGTVEFWYGGLSQTLIDAYMAAAEGLQQRNPKLKIRLENQQGFPDKLVVAFAGNSAPDAWNIQLIDALMLLPQGVYEPLDGAMRTGRYDVRALWPGLAEQYQWQGKQLVLWANVTTTVLYYNADLFKQEGRKNPSELAAQNRWTWDAALEAARALTRDDRSGCWTLTTPQALQPWIWMNGGKAFDSEERPTKVTMSLPETLGAMQWTADLRTRYKVAPTPKDLTALGASPRQLFYRTRLAMFAEQSNVDATAKGVAGAFTWDMGPLPTGKKGLFDFVGGQSIGASSQSKVKEAALEWVLHVAGPEGQREFVKRQIGLPTIKSMLDGPDWKNAPGAPAHVNVVVDLLGRARPIAKTHLWRPLATNAFNANITRMNNGDVSVREACALMDDLGTRTLQTGS